MVQVDFKKIFEVVYLKFGVILLDTYTTIVYWKKTNECKALSMYAPTEGRSGGAGGTSIQKGVRVMGLRWYLGFGELFT